MWDLILKPFFELHGSATILTFAIPVDTNADSFVHDHYGGIKLLKSVDVISDFEFEKVRL